MLDAVQLGQKAKTILELLAVGFPQDAIAHSEAALLLLNQESKD